MSQSLANIVVHLVFSTKDRIGYLDNATARQRLHAYVATVVRDNGCECFRIGGVADHVHLAVRLNKTLSLSKLVETVKSISSRWVKENLNLPLFSWQSGYGAFSVSPTERDKVIRYIDSQDQHHSRVSFQDELRALFNENGIEFDERYVWE